MNKADLSGQSLKLFNSVINMITIPVFYKDAAGVYLACNDVFASELGLSKDNIIGHTVFDIASAELAQVYWDADNRLLSGEIGDVGQFHDAGVLFADGTYHDVVFNKNLLRDDDNKVVGLIGVMFDITEEKNAERVLLEMKEELEKVIAWKSAIFNTSMVAVMSVTRERLITECNQTFLDMFGYATKAQIVGEQADMIYSSLQESERFSSLAYTKLMETGSVKLEAEFMKQDGSSFCAEISGMAVDRTDVSKGFTWVIVDIDERKRKEIELERLNNLFEASIEQNPIPVVLTAPATFDLIMANSAAKEFLGIKHINRGDDWLEISNINNLGMFDASGKEVPSEFRPLFLSMQGKYTKSEEFRYKLCDGQEKWGLVNAGPIYAKNGELLAEILTILDITERKRVEAVLESVNSQILETNFILNEKAITDGLTQIYNHQYIVEALHESIEYSERYVQPLAVLMVDIDYFKMVNDKFGHQSGDAVLTELAQTLKNLLRKSDSIGRYGGEEFMIILRNTAQSEAVIVAEKLRTAVESNLFSAQRLKVTVSIGVAQWNDMTAEAFITKADDNLYKAKRTGRNKVEA